MSRGDADVTTSSCVVLLVRIPVSRDSINECLIGPFVFAGCDGLRLPVGFSNELRSSHIGYPQLDGPETLLTQSPAVLANPSARTCHTTMFM